MSGRRRFLVAYDIREKTRLRRVYDVVKDHGDRLQYSVYVCDLTEMEKIGLLAALRIEMKQSEDSVAIVDLGLATSASPQIEFMGTALPLPDDGPLII